jgi:Na+/H+-dicarboxylate symporter
MLGTVILSVFCGYLIVIFAMVSLVLFLEGVLEKWFLKHWKKLLAPIIILSLVIMIAGLRHKLITLNGENACQQCCEEVKR